MTIFSDLCSIATDDNITKGRLNLYRQEMLYYFWQANQEMDGRI